MRTVPFSLVLLVLVGGLLAGACSSPPTLRTHSLQRAPTVDGALSEWGGSLTRVGDSPVSMSVAPTDSLLYVALLIPDQSLIRSIAKRGLIVWVDPSAKKTHTYGVQYPIALPTQRAAQKSASGAEASSGRPSRLDQLFPSDLALIRNDTIRRRMPAQLSAELRVKATLETGSLIYELAVPVPQAGSPPPDDRDFALPASLGRTITVGVQTPETGEDSGLEKQRPGVPSVTGRGRRRRPGGRRRRRRRRRQQLPSPSENAPTLDLWTRVLASNQ